MVVEDGLALEHRRRKLLPNKPLRLPGGLRRCAARAIISSARS